MRIISYISFCLLGIIGMGFGQAPENTVITSGRLEMQGTERKNYFTFEESVLVRGTNLEIRCDKLTVVSERAGTDQEGVGEIGAIETILAEGNVEIYQAGRSAFAGKAEVNPRTGQVILSDQPKIIDGEVEVEGYQFILHRGDKKFESIPDPNAPADKPSRSTVRLGALPDLGFDQEESEIDLKPERIVLEKESDDEEDSND